LVSKIITSDAIDLRNICLDKPKL